MIEQYDSPINNMQPAPSPLWSNTTKLVVGLTYVAVLAGLLIRFGNFVMPLLLTFIFSYLLYPVIEFLHKKLKLSWRLVVTLIFLLIIIVVIVFLVWGSLSIVEQLQNLISFSQRVANEIPLLIQRWTTQQHQLGPFSIDLRETDLNQFGLGFLDTLRPMLMNAGGIVGNLATEVFEFIGWAMFILIISYFLLAETEGIPGRMVHIDIPGYAADVQRMSLELSRIWNAFIRGQIVLMTMTFVIYSILLSALGLKFSIIMALLAALSRLVPYVGQFVVWLVYFLVAIFQTYHPFDIVAPLYAVIVVGLAFSVNSIIDNLISPSMMGDALQVHPAAVMVAALMAGSLLGVLGMFLAAPVLATLLLFSKYMIRKMTNRDPWQGMVMTGNYKGFTLVPAGFLSSVFLVLKNVFQSSLSKLSLLFKKSASSK